MRMWMVDPALMCRKHLLGEHVECHMLVGVLARGKRIQGFLDRGLLEPAKVQARHDALAREMQKRGWNHQSPIRPTQWENSGYVDATASLAELRRRCPDCDERCHGREGKEPA